MIYVTGDLHGAYRENRFPDMGENDYGIICGDFGVIWGDDHDDIGLDYLSEHTVGTLLFVDGNHECFPKIYDYPVIEWNGGLVHQIRPNILHLMRGYVYTLEDNKLFVMGGATSIDKMWRIEGYSWWPEEIPTEEEFQRGRDNLAACDWNVDYVFTHSAPNNIHDKILDRIRSYSKKHDAVTDYLQEIDSCLTYKHWYCGHYHDEYKVDDKHTLLYYNTEEVGYDDSDKRSDSGNSKTDSDILRTV